MVNLKDLFMIIIPHLWILGESVTPWYLINGGLQITKSLISLSFHITTHRDSRELLIHEKLIIIVDLALSNDQISSYNIKQIIIYQLFFAPQLWLCGYNTTILYHFSSPPNFNANNQLLLPSKETRI